MITTKKISSKDTLLLRNEVLRPGKLREECIFDGDDDLSTFHLGLFLNNKQVGILSVFQSSNLYFSESLQYQLRGMAILNEYRNKSLGAKLIEEAELILSSLNAELIWCNARQTAENFYKKHQYKSYDEYFEIKEIGLHLIMFKKLLYK
ncbi:MAG: putative GNAT family N-acyltransferase [Flavobacterium sp.]|jgi:predicted GNAT family N-acyltransferase